MTGDPFSLSDADRKCIYDILKPFAPQLDYVRVFGSRADGRARRGSDLDLLIGGEMDLHTLLRLGVAFEESDLPYRVDLVHERELVEPKVRNEIMKQAKYLLSQTALRALTMQ